MVPHAGVEPALLAELDFESSASTNSANGASGFVVEAEFSGTIRTPRAGSTVIFAISPAHEKFLRKA
jgi:hypothetical protein